ncbi:hypothetical protein JCM10213v2_008482 [Rhodosporidiobolus nylandii]
MARDCPNASPDAPASSSSLPHQQHLTYAVQPPSSLAGTQDLTAGFPYTRARSPVLPGGEAAFAGSGGAGGGRGNRASEDGERLFGGHRGSRSHRRPGADQDGETEDETDRVVLYRLSPSGAVSPPRAPLFNRTAAAPGGQTQPSFRHHTLKRFHPAGASRGQLQGGQPPTSASASAGISGAVQPLPAGQPVPFAAPGPHATQHQQQAKQQKSNLPASTAPAASIAVAAASSINPKKRIPSNESTGTTGTPPAASGSGRVKSAGEGGGATGGKGGGGGAGRNPAAQGGEQGAVAPARKRRKPEAEGGIADATINTTPSLSVERQAKDDEIRHLRQQLSEKTVEAQRLAADKEQIRGEYLAKVRAVLVKTGEAHDNLETTASEMRSGLALLTAEVTGGTTAEKVRVELESFKTTTTSAFSNQFFNGSHELWLERNEETKVAHLKDLCAQIEKRNDTIQLLRSQLGNRMGELAEAKKKVTDLENLLAVAKSDYAGLKSDLSAARQAAAKEKTDLTARLHDALVGGVPREEQQEAKLREVADEWARKLENAGKREELLREKWTKAKQGAAEKEDELRREMATVREAAEVDARRKEGELRDELDKGTRALRAKERDYEEVEARLRKLKKEQHNAVRSAEAVAAELRQTRTNLAQAEQIERNTEKRKTASVEAERDTEQRQTANLEAEREQHEQAQKELQAKLAQMEVQLAATSEASKGKAVKVEELKSKNARELNEASNTLALLHQQQHSFSLDADVAAQAQDVVRFRAQIDEFKQTVSQLTLDKASATAAREHAEEAVRSLNSEQQRLTVKRNRFSELASRWEAELLAAQTLLTKHAELVQALDGRLESAQNAESTLTAKLKEAEEKNDRPVLTEKITSSDSGGDASRFPPAGNSNGRIDSAAVVAPYAASGPVRSPSSDLTAVIDLEGSLDLESPKGKAKSVKFADGADHPEKTKRRPSLTSTTSKPLKKTDSKTKRRASEIDDDYYRDPSEKSGFDSAVYEDETTPKPRLPVKKTYGRKRRSCVG